MQVYHILVLDFQQSMEEQVNKSYWIQMIKNKKIYIVIICITLVWFFADDIIEYLNSKEKFNDTNFVLFYEHSLEEEVLDYNTDRGMIFIRFKGRINSEYAIWPLGKKNDRIFNKIAIGDSLFKESNSELFFLKKNDGTIYEYEISTFFNN